MSVGRLGAEPPLGDVITRKRTIAGRTIKSAARLRVVSVERLGIDLPLFDLTTGTGDFVANGVVSHNCFARPTHTFMDMDAGRDFETKIVVKVNVAEVLRAQLRSKSWCGEHIAMGTATDPYQRAEGKYRLMPGIIRTLADFRNPFSILTKGTLILRDLELLGEAAQVTHVSTALSIATVDDGVWRSTEPGTPHPRRRIEAVARLNAAGVPCGVMMMPILPGISDDPAMLRKTAEAAIDAGATFLTPGLLHLRPGVREEFLPWLSREHPELLARYESLYRRSYPPASAQEAFGRRAGAIIRDLGGPAGREAGHVHFARRRPRPPPVSGDGEQLKLL